jgi:hypothetical protein
MPEKGYHIPVFGIGGYGYKISREYSRSDHHIIRLIGPIEHAPGPDSFFIVFSFHCALKVYNF